LANHLHQSSEHQLQDFVANTHPLSVRQQLEAFSSPSRYSVRSFSNCQIQRPRTKYPEGGEKKAKPFHPILFIGRAKPT
jgi:hypothetical protein